MFYTYIPKASALTSTISRVLLESQTLTVLLRLKDVGPKGVAS
jgi:hypothetical protein